MTNDVNDVSVLKGEDGDELLGIGSLQAIATSHQHDDDEGYYCIMDTDDP